MEFHSCAVQTADTTAEVHWRISRKGVSFGGLLRLSFEKEYDHLQMVAESVAFRHLMFEAQVTGGFANDTSQIKWIYSSPGVGKALQGKLHSKSHVFAGPIRVRCMDMKLKHRKSQDHLPVEEAAMKETLYLVRSLHVEHGRYADPAFYMEVPAIGTIGITYHALQQFIERFKVRYGEEPSKGFKALKNRLMHDRLAAKSLPDVVRAHKERKYGKEAVAEAYGHSSSSFQYIFVKDAATGAPVLVTVSITTGQTIREEDLLPTFRPSLQRAVYSKKQQKMMGRTGGQG